MADALVNAFDKHDKSGIGTVSADIFHKVLAKLDPSFTADELAIVTGSVASEGGLLQYADLLRKIMTIGGEKFTIKELETYFDPSAVAGGKPDFAEKVNRFIEQYADALFKHEPLLHLFAPDPSWTDPVGTPSHIGRSGIAERIKKLPPMDFVKVNEIFYTMSDNIFLVKVDVQFEGKDQPLSILDKVVVNSDMNITKLETHFHPSAVGGGKPDFAENVDKFIDKYADALFQQEPLLELFAPDISWTDPVGTSPHVGRSGIAERITKLPPMDFVKVNEIFYTVNEQIFLVKVDLQFKGKDKPFSILDKVVVNDDMQITQLAAHFHPSAVTGGKPEFHAKIDEFVERYADALSKHQPLLDLFASTGDISWTDPVGVHVGRTAIAKRIKNLLPMEFVKANEIFYTGSDKIFLVKVEVKFKGKDKSFFIVDSIVVNDDMKITQLEAHFHPSAVQGGKPYFSEKVNNFIEQYADALFKHEPLLHLFAPDISWTEPVGTPSHIGRSGIADRIATLPPMVFVKVNEIFYTMSDKIFLVKVDLQFKGKDEVFSILDKVVVNDDMQITQLEAHYHPSALEGGKPDFHDKVNEFIDKYADALFKHEPLLDLFAPDIFWMDPVGAPAHIGRSGIAARISKLPPMDFVKVNEIFYTVSEEVFLVKVDVQFEGRHKSFSILDKVVVNDDMQITQLAAHFHPSAVAGGKPDFFEKVDEFVEQYADALLQHDLLLELFASTGVISWTDPAGTRVHVGRTAFAESIKKLPPVDFVKVNEIFYSLSDKHFLVKVEVKLKGKDQSFFIVDSVVMS